MTIIVFSRCDYSTKVISSSEPPDEVFSSFIAAMKDKDYEKADSFLANGATIIPENQTSYAFFNDYVDVSLDQLQCESVGEPVYDGTTATVKANLVSIDSEGFLAWTDKNLARVEHDYMVKKDIKEFDNTDKKAVDEIMAMALKEYTKHNPGQEHDIVVNFVYSKKNWKILGDEDLVKAIFGGNDNEGKDNADKKGTERDNGSGD